ncbi:Rieske 2Fe-2S domain-containing protein [Actinomycetospora termitidis]|uniref:Rieske 2Fe-2S domain-containing protein n=1 Tax=Actinomycetospora termitidis TaxID=3053470 RepID=A0ABT7M7G4_9PSEU|nr:Rieske 2Fe-2S domain-containing protein [Actinomycetospora sp. Odt1-22]MDL5156134.1 Rieske 2Fe-2S domain-containing protein [Actinomycetospora sp. Odt1-22]
MLTAEENETLTRVGPQTPMGRMMRRFWMPIATSAQVPEPDGDPLRARLFGESFVVFRDSAGQIGVLDELCMHRGVSLALGRVEDGGVRCLYHGWKFGADGTILDTPNHCSERFRTRMKAPAYPVVEAGGLVWTYIGPKKQQPPFPHFAFMDVPEENRTVIRANVACNYLQLYEGGVDSSHVGILHSNQANPTWKAGEFTANDEDDNPGAISVADNAPALEIEDTAFGFHYVAKRVASVSEDGTPAHSIRTTPVFLPVGRVIPAPTVEFYVFEVPLTDVETATFIVIYGDRPVSRPRFMEMLGLDDERFFDEASADFLGHRLPGFGQDRPSMATGWTGLRGIQQEDATLALSMGPIVDRTKEHVVAADRAIMHLRAQLLESVRGHEAGGHPLGLVADYGPMRSLCDTDLEPGQAWQDHVPGNRTVTTVADDEQMATTS